MQVNYENRVGGKPGKKKSHLNLTVGGGGIGGLVLLGGGLVAAALVAAFTVIKKKNSTRYDKNEQSTITKNDNAKREAGQGLSFVLQTPSEITVNQNLCCTSHEASTAGVTVTHIDSGELVFAHGLVLEDKPVPITIGDGIENPETSTEEFSLAAADDKPEIVIKNDSVKGFQFIATTAAKKENEAVDAEVLAREENLPMLSVEEEEDGVDDDDVHEENVIEAEEEKSEGKFAVEENSPTQEMLLSDEWDKESIAAGDDILCNEDSSLAVPDGPSLDEPENMIHNDSGENLQFRETIEVIKEDEAVNTDKLMVEENSSVQSIEDHEDNICEEQVMQKEEERSVGKLAVEDNLPMQSVENLEKQTEDYSSEEHASETVEEDSQVKLVVYENTATQQVEEEENDDDDGDNSSEEVTEEEEEEDSSEGTGSSSMESNVEAIWPAEMIDARNHDFVDCQSDDKNDSEERGSHNETTEHSRMTSNKKAAQELVTGNDLMVRSSKRRVWIWSMLVLLLLLLLLIVHRIAILQDLPY